MKSEYVIPFIDAAVDTFETMCDMTPKRCGDIVLEKGVFPTYDTIAILGMSGTVRGAVMLTMPTDVACKLVGGFVGEEIEEVNAELTDGLGELLNILAGAAIAKLTDLKIKISLPTVLIGKTPMLSGNQNSPWLIVPMSFDTGGKFVIKITMEEL